MRSKDMDQQDKLRVISALHNEARRLERVAASRKSAGPALTAYREGFRKEARAMDGIAAGIRNAGGVYTRDEISDAVNGGADLIDYSDEINLIVNAQLTRLDNPDATMDDVILANWQADEEDYEEAGLAGFHGERELTEDEARRVDAALIERVKGWSGSPDREDCRGG
jgi:hypothetical protein